MEENRIIKIVITLKQGWYIVRVEYTLTASDVLTFDNKDEALASRDQYLAQEPGVKVEYRGFTP